MISRVYTTDSRLVDGKMECYKGFDKNMNPERLSKVGIVFFEGVVEVYALDEGEHAEKEFMRFVQDEIVEWGDELYRFVGFYVRTKT